MIPARLLVESRADDDIRTAYRWYETQQEGLGERFSAELQATYQRIFDGPQRYGATPDGVRHARLRRFPYSVYFVIEDDVIIVFAVLHGRRDPVVWQRRRG